MVKVSFLGSCQEVGRSAILIESEETSDSILLDYGIKMSGGEDNFPKHVSGKDLTAIVVTHSHIDHVGGVPIFYISGQVPLYMTKLAFDVSKVLLKDMLKISEFYLPFSHNEVSKMGRYARFLSYKQRTRVGKGSYITLYNNGHIPGSAMVLVEMDGKKIVYTSDANLSDTQLMSGIEPIDSPIDLLITECTYGTTNHEPRKEVERKFINAVNETLDNNGAVLVPAFGVSRSQEIIMVLYDYQVDAPIVVDGMARQIGRIYKSARHKEFFRNWSKMTKAFQKAHFIRQRNRYHERRRAKNSKSVIVAPSGMLKGGTARMYAEAILDDPNSAILLVSYQIPGSPGELLLKEGKYEIYENHEKILKEVACDVKFFDFSSHSGQDELLEYANKCKFTTDDKKVVAVHGDEEVASGFVEFMKDHGFNASAPEEGTIYKI